MAGWTASAGVVECQPDAACTTCPCPGLGLEEGEVERRGGSAGEVAARWNTLADTT